MAGLGAPPKDPARRARRNKDAARPVREIALEPIGPHDLPDDLLPEGDPNWHPATLRWWDRWTASPLAESLPAVDWSELEATAVLHHEFMKKRSFTLASELRLRMQKFGATPEDRMRLRIIIADAEQKDEKRGSVPASRARRGSLHALPDVKASGA